MSSGEQYFSQANEQFVAEDYTAAASLYNQAIETNPNVANYYIARAANSIKLKKYKAAVTDAEAAIKLDSKNNLCYFRKGTATFYLDNFAEAKTNFEQAQTLGNKQSAIWIRKCEAELDRLKPKSTNNNNNATTSTNNNTSTQPLAKPTATSVSAAVDQAVAKATTTTNNNNTSSAPVSSIPLSDKVKDSFYQSKPSITVTLFAKNLKHEDVKIDYNETENRLSAMLHLPDSSVYQKSWKLFAPVLPEFKTEITAYKVEITLTKKEPADWLGLEEKEASKLTGVVKRENVINDLSHQPSYPSSSKKKTDFNEVEKVVKEEEATEKPEGEQALQKLFQTIYKDSSEDTRRAMIKSFQTSGGTVLSTNWDEVAKADYTKDRTAPQGQEFRDWNNPTGKKDDDDEELAG